MSRLLLLATVLGVAVFSAHGTPPVVLVPAQQGTYSFNDDMLKQMVELNKLTVVELRLLRQDVQALRAGPPQPPAGLTLQAVIANKCVSCHGADVAVEKGASFVLVEKDGKLAELSITEKRRVVREVENGRMPKPPITLTPEERATILILKEELKK